MMRIEAVTLYVLLLKRVEVAATELDNKQWMNRFTSDPSQAFLRSINHFSVNKTLYLFHEQYKKDEIIPNYDSIVKTDIQEFPSTEQTKRMMFALFGDEGVFMKENFKRSGEIHIEGPALVSVWKVFPNKSVLLEEIKSSKNASIGSSVFSVLTQMLFLPKDVSKLEDWLQKGIEIGDEENDRDCAPKVLINYKCCEVTGDPILAPEFASIEIGID